MFKNWFQKTISAKLFFVRNRYSKTTPLMIFKTLIFETRWTTPFMIVRNPYLWEIYSQTWINESDRVIICRCIWFIGIPKRFSIRQRDALRKPNTNTSCRWDSHWQEDRLIMYGVLEDGDEGDKGRLWGYGRRRRRIPTSFGLVSRCQVGWKK